MNFKTFMFLISSSLIIYSCAGQNSNPLEKYPGLKSAEPNQQNIENQTIIQPDLFELQVNGTNQVNQIQYVEGQDSEVLLKVSLKTTNILNYKIEMTDFSSIERPALLSTFEKNVFSLRWSPPVGIIPTGQWTQSFKAQFQITVLDANNKILVGIIKNSDLNIVVNRNNIQPLILGRTDLSKGINEGTQTVFTIDVEDKAGVNNPRRPEMQITPYIYSNTEAYRADASRYLVLNSSIKNNPEKIGTNQFRFYYLIDIDRLPLDRDRLGNEVPNATTVDICFLMRAVSAVGTLSNQLQVCSVGHYQAQPPQFLTQEKELAEIKAGVENTIHITIHAEHPLSQVSVLTPNTQITNLPGKKELTCAYSAPENKNNLLCNLVWTPSCIKSNSVKILTLKAETTINQSSRNSTFNKELTILINPEICNAPVKTSQGVK